MRQDSALFIVFEGLDGAGTTTQSGRLQDYFTHNGTLSFVTFEPTASDVGSFVRKTLTGGARKLDERAMALLFAADRLDHSTRVRDHIAAGKHVVCDRYVFSSMAYQTLDSEIPAEWVVSINEGCAIPDITFFLEVPVDVCLDRLKARGDEPSVYEKRDLLDRIATNYRNLSDLYQTHYGKLITIDGTQTMDEIHRLVVAHLTK